MQSIQTCFEHDLSKVKPLEEVLRYREYCLQMLREAYRHGITHRSRSPIDQTELVDWGKVAGLEYGLCSKTGSLFLTELPPQDRWRDLLAKVNEYRQINSFKGHLREMRLASVYEPKRAWIEDTLRWHHLKRPKVLEMTTLPSELTSLLAKSNVFGEVFVWEEGQPCPQGVPTEGAEVAILLESLDRAWDPLGLIQNVFQSLTSGGMLFLTALVSSGFDIKVLGSKNLYLCPPDRTNCFSLAGLTQLLSRVGFSFLEVSTPGLLDVEIVKAHRLQDPSIPLSGFEAQFLASREEILSDFQIFLQRSSLSSFARVVAKKQ